MKKKLDSSITSVELGSGSKKIPSRRKPMSTSERIDSLPKVNLKRKTINKPMSTLDLELKADNSIIE